MKTSDWMKFLDFQNRRHGKALFRVAELANATGHAPHALNVELGRLASKGAIARYATGVYGLPGRATPEELVTVLDNGAYITGAYALNRQNLITQASSEIVCFTNRRHNRSRARTTPFGKIVFVRVASNIYRKPAEGALAPPEQAFCDFVRLTQRQGLDPSTIVTFRGLNTLSKSRLSAVLKRYPLTVLRKANQLLGI